MKLFFAVLWVAAFSLPLGLAQAQTAVPAKPVSKPASPAVAPGGGKTLSLGGGAAASAPAQSERRPIMTRDELRTCLNSQVDIRTRLEALEATRAPLQAEKAAIAADQQVFREERTAMEADQKTATDDLNARFNAFSEKVEKSNARVQAFNDADRTGRAADRERVAINAERTALDAERKELEAERDRTVERLKLRVAAYNDKAKLVDQRVTDWNNRNNQFNDDAEGLEAERKDWVAECSNRRYMEDDEAAIKAGK